MRYHAMTAAAQRCEDRTPSQLPALTISVESQIGTGSSRHLSIITSTARGLQPDGASISAQFCATPQPRHSAASCIASAANRLAASADGYLAWYLTGIRVSPLVHPDRARLGVSVIWISGMWSAIALSMILSSIRAKLAPMQ